MSITALMYSKNNHCQNKTATHLISKIVAENGNKIFETVVDIGCGTGHVTTELSNTLKINKVFGIDKNDDMIMYCLQNNKQSNTEYITQDISVEWNQLKPELRPLEGHVSLCFSNMVFHWIDNKRRAAGNMVRLLADDGVLYACHLTMPSIFTESDEENQILKQILTIPSAEEQKEVWRSLFSELDCSVRISESISEDVLLDNSMVVNAYVQIAFNIYHQYCTEKDAKVKQLLMNDNSALIVKGIENGFNVRPVYIDGEQRFYFATNYYYLIVKKVIK